MNERRDAPEREGEARVPDPDEGRVNQGEYAGRSGRPVATEREDRETEEAREQLAEAGEEATTARSRTDRPTATRSGALPPPGYERARVRPDPSSSDEARRELAETRGRISDTLDEIEYRVGEKKRNLQENTIGLVRRAQDEIVQRPIFAMGVAFGAGMALGLMTGGDDEEASGGGPSFTGRTMRSLAMMGASRYAARWLQKRIG